MKNLSVSIVVPVYNASKYILETLESVRNQSYSDWELIIVDDGSSDSSAELVQEFVSANPGKARLLFHPHRRNRGTSASRNLGLKSATGELVCFLDADDVWDQGFLQFFVDKFNKFPEISMAYCPCIYWHPASAGIQAGPADSVQKVGLGANRTLDGGTLFGLFLGNEDTVPSPSGVMIRHRAMAEAGGWEEEFRGMYDDQVLYSKLFLQGAAVYVADRPLYRYRQHDDSLCKIAVRENRLHESRKAYLEWLNRYLDRNVPEHESRRRVINEQVALLEIKRDIDGTLEKITNIRNLLGNLWRENDFFLNLRSLRSVLCYAASRIGQAEKRLKLFVLANVELESLADLIACDLLALL